ncbi:MULTISPECIES: RecQ family ATP-dependent DNA helicase [unclassified Paenibacillus]|uniref:RecQ family ATP-dependent DNA helicase n=1 Tax=unclassified Paenibacillus TaxID=185978 RepID=UPI000CFB5014|nr:MULTISPECIES: RecQ family ATP-dependent DNA helicase [unclassified Paenibacillus]PQZ99032.1 ATP-binding protein [Paenibacillus sp. MYb63]PRA43967.1 ATP-binding protein [Paenibacillus sp. MYb67]QZN77853.1 RecQ family ATP-dependent DNA helicase [Paenibacillus sp. DR312]
MEKIVFVDTEIQATTGKIMDIGAVHEDGMSYHSSSVQAFTAFIQGVRYVCGHNIIHHDLNYLRSSLSTVGIDERTCIDTLYWSPLLFPKKFYHALLKDDKLQSDEANNPLNDAMKARELFADEVEEFLRLPTALRHIYSSLLWKQREFSGFLDYVRLPVFQSNPASLIKEFFSANICEHAEIGRMVAEQPVALAYALGLIYTNDLHLITGTKAITPPWVLQQYPETERFMFLLRSKSCLSGCAYCNEKLDVHKGLHHFFGYNQFRRYGGEPLQEQAVKAAVANKSLLAVFPTGGGKSVTFQLPALMSGQTMEGVTLVISPLQSLMKDQVDNLERKGITKAVTINGLLDPIERAKSFARVEDGSASLLYISPESLRSASIERLLLGRNLVRVVIDEAHCFSSWGQDFRVDYLYIGDFIKSLQEKKNSPDPIPVSCFTATAKQQVIEDIRDYFRNKLGLELELYETQTGRTNLRYNVLKMNDEQEKYNTTRRLLDSYEVPSIIYVSRTRKAAELAERLCQDGYVARAYHGKMDKQEKMSNQDAFIGGEVPIMVATSAFGMGVDKPDVGLVLHYEISDSLENYVQEAGRAGRDESISAVCYVLFHDEDLSKHFILLNQTKLSIREIGQVWQAIKVLSNSRSTISESALEIARKAGWDESVLDIETKVKTAIAALEKAGYVKRGHNRPRVFASGIISRNAAEAIARIQSSERFDSTQKEAAGRIIRKLFSTKSRKHANEEIPEARIDYISDHLGMNKKDVIRIIQLLREENILADTKDLTAYIKSRNQISSSMATLNRFKRLEVFLRHQLEDEGEHLLHLKELNEQAESDGIKRVSIDTIKIILNIWAIQYWIKRQTISSNHVAIVRVLAKQVWGERMERRHELATFIVSNLHQRSSSSSVDTGMKEDMLVEFSVLELKEAYNKSIKGVLTQQEATIEEIEDAIFYLSRIDAIKLEGGFLVIYNTVTLQRLEMDKKRRYRLEDYADLTQFYQSKIQQIHIVGEYAAKMVEDERDALQFVGDYFQMHYGNFLNKYFKGHRREEINRTITPTKFHQLFGELSPAQLNIVNDKDSHNIVVLAGPGSGKTRLLVHKLASLMLMEDVKHEQMLMLTFSRAAATEFKKRLLELVGNAAHYIEIKTFHSYCFDLLGKIGSLEKSDAIIRETVRRIHSGEVEVSRITKTVLVLDEAQDMNADEYELVQTLKQLNEDMRIIAVGDDDQNIYMFRHASSRYMAQLLEAESSRMYELVENYRSRPNLIAFTNQWVQQLSDRLKRTSIQSIHQENGMLEIVTYNSDQLVIPLVERLRNTGMDGTTAVLAYTNEEAMQVFTRLVENKIPAKLVISNDGFNLSNLFELRYFLLELRQHCQTARIQQDVWEQTLCNFKERFKRNPHLEACLGLFQDFADIHAGSMYMTDLESFISESNLEDFVAIDRETVYVSTIHKAKGREYEKVFLLLRNLKAGDPTVVRAIYVAMTRAKQHLSIHYNGSYLDHLNVESMQRVADSTVYPPSAQLAIPLTLRDLWLDFCMRCQSAIVLTRPGDQLQLDGRYILNARGQKVAALSGRMLETIGELHSKGYEPVNVAVRYIVYWKKAGEEREILIPIPDIMFKRG